MKDAFSRYNPIVNLIFFAETLGLTMFIRQPVCLGIAFATAFVYAVYLTGRQAASLFVRFILPVAVCMAALNPVFNHQGLTILGYFPNGNPFTLESIVYGAAAAGTLAAVILWFSCWNQIMTAEKLIYLMGRRFPTLSLVLSMTLGFLPRYGRQYRAAALCYRAGEYGGKRGGGLLRSVRDRVRIVSIVLSWAMEHGVETAASMKARGYGLTGRTSFSVYRWTKRDTALTVWLAVCGAYMLRELLRGRLYWTCFPTFLQTDMGAEMWLTFGVYAALSWTPMLINGMEEIAWSYSGWSR